MVAAPYRRGMGADILFSSSLPASVSLDFGS